MVKRKRASMAASASNSVAVPTGSRSLRSSSVRSRSLNRVLTESKPSISPTSSSDKDEDFAALTPSNTRSRPKRAAQSLQARAHPSKLAKIKRSSAGGKQARVPTKHGEEERNLKINSPETTGKDAESEITEPEQTLIAASRPSAVNSEYRPLPWRGRLGYACLCTYLRYSNPPFFCSRTTRIASILEHRHPLADPSQPEHPTKNRPDKTKPADIRRGQEFVERLGLANCRDIIKLLKWNEKYGIKFMRISSEAFPFASHAEYGYRLAPFASDDLKKVGQVVASLGHRVTTHPGQFTQLGSPRQSVIEASVRDLEYHDEMLSLLDLPPQQNRDAVMVLHMGGVFGDKGLTLSRFRESYGRLPQSVKNRLVLENDDVSWSVHDLLPICEELNIPLVLDFHHHNIVHDPSKVREGTKDIMELFPRIKSTWVRKNITQKMHYSEPNFGTVTPRERRKHSPRVADLPPCPNDMDLMIEAKDKEQAVFELMKVFKLPGYDKFQTIIPHVREDINNAKRQPGSKRKTGTMVQAPSSEFHSGEESLSNRPDHVAEDEVGMGGPERRVYWPPGMEHWLRPRKRVITCKEVSNE